METATIDVVKWAGTFRLTRTQARLIEVLAQSAGSVADSERSTISQLAKSLDPPVSADAVRKNLRRLERAGMVVVDGPTSRPHRVALARPIRGTRVGDERKSVTPTA